MPACPKPVCPGLDFSIQVTHVTPRNCLTRLLANLQFVKLVVHTKMILILYVQWHWCDAKSLDEHRTAGVNGGALYGVVTPWPVMPFSGVVKNALGSSLSFSGAAARGDRSVDW